MFTSAEESCSLAIVMLNYFDPRELGLPPRAIFSSRDVTSFNDVGWSALSVANECLSKYATPNETTDRLSFTSQLGWASLGAFILIAVRSDIVVRTDADLSRYDWLHWCLSLGHGFGH